MTRTRPIPRRFRSNAAAAIVWTVLPSPMSSARTMRPRLAANRTPSTW